MTAAEVLELGVTFAFGWFAVGLLFLFASAVLLGFVDFVRRFLG